ncbi:MAG: polysaccharide deacetylase family protein [Candidatus Latescibacteria bacterium]|jgi:peptidoglycan-N-acetylglucosamine deacetylase|nr:polysaccharide deacetylase family protein [Candidatus Latescibacterota bacterium]
MIDEIVSRLEHVPPEILKKILSGFLWEGTTDSGVMALTFDDGPDPVVTPGVLDVLDECGIRGTFFMTGEKVAAYPGIAREVAGRGHLIGNHSMTHRKLFLIKRIEIEREIDEAQNIINNVTGIKAEWFRPPYGMFDFTCADVVKMRDMTMVLWTVLSGDYSDDPPDSIMKTVEPYVRPGSIAVFHDTARGGGLYLHDLIKEIAGLAGQRNVRFGGIDEISVSQDITLDE